MGWFEKDWIFISFISWFTILLFLLQNSSSKSLFFIIFRAPKNPVGSCLNHYCVTSTNILIRTFPFLKASKFDIAWSFDVVWIVRSLETGIELNLFLWDESCYWEFHCLEATWVGEWEMMSLHNNRGWFEAWSS